MLAGKVLVMVEAVSHQPLWQDYTEDALPHDKRLAGRFWWRYHQAACWSLIWGFSAFYGAMPLLRLPSIL
jgi:hypothetical protein